MIRLAIPARCALVCGALSLGLASCWRGERARSASPDSVRAVAINPSTPAGQIALELWQLRPGVTLGEWKGIHPDEAVQGSDTATLGGRFLGPWCAFAGRRTQAGTLSIVRAAYFYAPAPPPSLAVPDSGAIDLVRQCALGLVWVNVEVGDSAAAVALADSVRQQLRAVYGPEVPASVQFFGSAFWSRVGRFRKDSLVAVSALRAPPPGARAGARPRFVTAFAYLPFAGVSVSGDPVPRDAWAPQDTFPLDSAAVLAQMDTSLYGQLRALVHEGPSVAQPSAVAPESLVRPLVRWLRASAALPPPRRAAALYIADRVLDGAMCRYGLCGKSSEPALAPLRALGAQFAWSELGGTEVYVHTWLTQARALSRDSPLGQRILLAQLASGFDFSGMCAAGSEGFRRVIDNGERYLARLPDSPIAPDVHYLVGVAYVDIVALAHGVAGEYADSSRYGGEVAEAARKALGHYIAAMRAGQGHPAARAAWSRAWWLRAGLVPRDVRFYCVED